MRRRGEQVKGTKVLAVHMRNLSFLTGFTPGESRIAAEIRIAWGWGLPGAGIGWKFPPGTGTINVGFELRQDWDCLRNKRGKIVNRLVRNALLLAAGGILAGAGSLLGQSSAKKSAPAANSEAAKRGKNLFQEKCALCHYDTTDQKKIGPGLKGLSKRGTFSVNGNKITDDSLKAWIENGDQLMPPFKDVLEPDQIKDVIAYVKTL